MIHPIDKKQINPCVICGNIAEQHNRVMCDEGNGRVDVCFRCIDWLSDNKRLANLTEAMV